MRGELTEPDEGSGAYRVIHEKTAVRMGFVAQCVERHFLFGDGFSGGGAGVEHFGGPGGGGSGCGAAAAGGGVVSG